MKNIKINAYRNHSLATSFFVHFFLVLLVFSLLLGFFILDVLLELVLDNLLALRTPSLLVGLVRWFPSVVLRALELESLPVELTQAQALIFFSIFFSLFEVFITFIAPSASKQFFDINDESMLEEAPNSKGAARITINNLVFRC